MDKVVLKVEGMSCGHCKAAVEKALGGQDGVKAVDVNLEEKKVEVEFIQDKVTIAQIKDIIENEGYDVLGE